MVNDKGWKRYLTTSAGYEEMLAELQEFCDAQGLSPKRQLRLELGFEEAAVNIISYAYVTPGDIYLRLSMREGSIAIELLDYGEPFNPLEKHVIHFQNLFFRYSTGRASVLFCYLPPSFLALVRR